MSSQDQPRFSSVVVTATRTVAYSVPDMIAQLVEDGENVTWEQVFDWIQERAVEDMDGPWKAGIPLVFRDQDGEVLGTLY